MTQWHAASSLAPSVDTAIFAEGTAVAMLSRYLMTGWIGSFFLELGCGF
jgi:hypothetical protein